AVDLAHGDDAAVLENERVLDPSLERLEDEAARAAGARLARRSREVAGVEADEVEPLVAERRDDEHARVEPAARRQRRALGVAPRLVVVVSPVSALHEDEAALGRAVGVEDRHREDARDRGDVPPRRELVREVYEPRAPRNAPELLEPDREVREVSGAPLEGGR